MTAIRIVSSRPRVPLNTGRKSLVATVPPPVGGWNTRDALTSMPQEDAIVLDNWFPDIGHCTMRNGFSEFCATGNSTAVETLHWHYDNTNSDLLAFCAGSIYDITSGTAASLSSGKSNNRWCCVNFKQVSVMVNGADTPQQYNGTAISNATYTGPTPTNLVGVHVFKERLFFWENTSASFWYGGSQAITGALTEFPLSMVGTKGGYIIGMGTMSVDGGAGPDDLLCIFLSGGFVVIYSGSDPSDATKWAIVGIYNMGQPVHQRAIVKYGADLLCVTRDGFVALSQIIRDDFQVQSAGISDKIQHSANAAVRDYFTNFGWQICAYPQGKYILFNIPKTSATFDQYVMNLQTKAWCRFTSQNAPCWSLFNGNLYFGGTNGKIYLADDGTADDKAEIVADARSAWNYFGTPGNIKRFTGWRPQLSAIGNISFQYRIDYDFRLLQVAGSSTTDDVLASGTGDTGGPPWDTTPWDEAYWAQESPVTLGWKSAAGIGNCASTRLRISNDTLTVSWLGNQYMVSGGGLL